jgi:hypothetical protein
MRRCSDFVECIGYPHLEPSDLSGQANLQADRVLVHFGFGRVASLEFSPAFQSRGRA